MEDDKQLLTELFPIFEKCIDMCAKNPEFVANYNRLKGTNLFTDKRTPLEKMVDTATGYQKIVDENKRAEFHDIAEFVYQFVFMPYIGDAMKNVLTK